MFVSIATTACKLVAGGASSPCEGEICDQPFEDASITRADAANPLLDAGLPPDSADESTPDAMALPVGLVAWYPMDEAPAGSLRDVAGTHAGTCTSCPALVTGKLGNAYQFSNDFFRIPRAADLETPKGTIAFWVKVNAPVDAGLVAKPFGTAIQNSLLAILWADGALAVEGTAYYHSTGVDVYPFDGTWHHVTLTRTATSQKLYLDADVIIDQPISTSFDQNDFYVGSEFDNGMNRFFLNGALDDLRFYNRVLSDSEISEIAAQ